VETVGDADIQHQRGSIEHAGGPPLVRTKGPVTGSTAGIGAAIARQLASEGVAVVVHGRDEQRGKRLAAELTGAGRRATFIGADLERPADITRLASQARAARGAIDMLVNNAAIYPQHTWFEGAADEWTRYYEVNVVAGVRLIQEFVPEMKRAGWDA
jgi:3-oxoacyl-[acyl-carrier protein] reductase